MCRRVDGAATAPAASRGNDWRARLLVAGSGILAALAAGVLAWSLLAPEQPSARDVSPRTPPRVLSPPRGAVPPPDDLSFPPPLAVPPRPQPPSAVLPRAAPSRDPRAVQRGQIGDPSDRQRLFEAARSVPITMYAAAWCPHCRHARAWFKANGIAYTDREVDRDAAAEAELRRINPRGGLPTIVVDGQVLVGFSEQQVAQAINDSANRRLRARHP